MSIDWQTPLHDAIALRTGGQADAALPRFIALASACPDVAVVHYQTAWCHDVLGLERQAVPYYETALTLGLSGDDLTGAYLGLGSTLRSLGEYERALAVLTRGVAACPDDAGLRVFLAMARYNAGQAKTAVSDLLTVLVATTADPGILAYERAIRLYADDLDRIWS